ncbi:MAG: PAS domain-containing sensor histidine kinase, partial [Promethearchaeota archaeon]
FDNSLNNIILLDSNGRVLDANAPFLNIFTYKEDDLIGKSFQQLENISLNNSSIYKEKFKNIFDKGILEPFELQVEVKDEKFRWMSIQGSLIDIEGKKLLQVIFQDINERKEAEQKLRESEEKYRIISENANDLIAVINEKFRFEYINEEAHKRVTGYSKEDLIGKSPLNNFHPDDIKTTVKTWRDGVISGEGMTEFRYKKKDGTWIWLEMRGKKFIDTNGEPKGVIISRDITKSKIAEKKLKESEEKYRHLFDSSPYSIGLLDLDGTLIEGNEATNKFLSARTKDELIGKNIREIFSPTEQDRSIFPKITNYFKKVIKDEIREPLEIPITRSTGGVIWISFYGSLIKIGDKTLLQFLGQDITDRKRAEEDLKKSEQKYRLLFENSPNSIILANSKGILLDFNDVTEKLLGFKRDELIGKNYTTISPPEHVKIMRKRYEDHLKGIPLKPIEYEIMGRDGNQIWVNFQNKIIKLDDEDISISIIQDITKRKEAEILVKEELIKLKELDQIRKDLISRVSHELKTPLIPVISGTELLTTIYRDQIGNDALEIIDMIDKGGARLKDLVEKLINVSRIEYNKFEVRKESFNLSEIIKRSANGMKFLMEQRRLKLKCEIPDKLHLVMDELRIEEVITNLLSNA